MPITCSFNGKTRFVDLQEDEDDSVRRLKRQICQEKGLSADDFYFVVNGRLVEDEAKLQTDAVYNVCYRLPGGKGGFGSMLRMIGAQIEKTTNREACRDLSGRRLRDVNDEKRLAEWLKKQADREKERQAKKREKLEKMASEPRHIFSDQKYSQQKESIMENVHDALTQGMQAAASEAAQTSGSSLKRKSNGKDRSEGKKQRLWLGVDIDSNSSSNDDDEEDEEEETEEDKEMKKLCQKYLDEMKQESKDGGNGKDQQPGCSRDSQGMDAVSRKNEDATAEESGDVPKMQKSDVLRTDKGGPVAGRESSGAKTDTGSATEDCAGTQQSSHKTAEKCEHSLLSSLPPPQNDPKTGGSGDPQTEQLKDDSFEWEQCGDVSELESLGLDRLKLALMERGLKCGGTLQERAARLFSVKGLEKHQINPSLFAKPSKGKGKKKQV